MISIRRLLEGGGDSSPEDAELSEACLQLRRIMQEAIAIRGRLGHETGMVEFELRSRDLLRRLEQPTSPLEMVMVANQAMEAIEEYWKRSTEYFKEQGSHLQSMLAMLAGAIADISGHSDASV